MLAYLKARNIPTTASAEKIYSRDANIWHISHEGGELEDPWNAPPEDVWMITTSPKDAPDTAEDVSITFSKGFPTAVNGKALDPVALLTELNAIAARNGVGAAIRALVSEGTGDATVGRSGPYAVITANILARPLRAMSATLARLLVPGGYLILAGLLQKQEALVTTAYRAQGLRLVRRIVRRPWSILVFQRAFPFESRGTGP